MDVVREIVFRLGLEQQKADIQAPDLRPLEEAVRRVEDQVSAARDAAFEQFGELDQSIDELAEGYSDLSSKVEESAARTNAANRSVLASVGNVTSSLLQAARGATLLGAGSEDIEQLVQSLARVQAGIDLFEGLSGAGKGVAEILGTASEAAGKFEGRLGSLAPMLSRVSALAGPVGVGVGAAISAGVLLWQDWGDAAEDASEQAIRALSRVVQQGESVNEQLSLAFRQLRDRAAFESEEQQLEGLFELLRKLGPKELSPDQLAQAFGVTDREDRLGAIDTEIAQLRRNNFRTGGTAGSIGVNDRAIRQLQQEKDRLEKELEGRREQLAEQAGIELKAAQERLEIEKQIAQIKAARQAREREQAEEDLSDAQRDRDRAQRERERAGIELGYVEAPTALDRYTEAGQEGEAAAAAVAAAASRVEALERETAEANERTGELFRATQANQEALLKLMQELQARIEDGAL